MWIVRLALRRPYTFVVVSLLMLLLGIGTCVEAPKDIYPYINIPVVTIVWSYTGLPPQEMEGRIVTVCERALTTTVNDIEHTQSESYQGVSVIRVFFQPKVKVELALVADHGRGADHPARSSARHLPAEHPAIRRVQRAHCAARAFRAGPDRRRSVRPGTLVHPAAPGQCEGRVDSAAVWRQGAAGAGGCRSQPDVRQASFRDRCFDRIQPAEPDSAGRRWRASATANSSSS